MADKRALVVDDDPLARAVLEGTLEEAGFERTLAQDWSSMNAVLFDEPYSVVILDVHLPGVSGDALAPMIQELVTPCPSILLWSSLPEETLRHMVARSGAYDYIVKGQSERRIRAVLDRAHRAFEGGVPAETTTLGDRTRARQAREAREATPVDPTRTDPGHAMMQAVADGEWARLDWLPRVLIADDSLVRRAYLEDWFRERGFEVRAVPDGERALQVMRDSREEERPQLVVSDVSMPRVSGLELTRRIREDEAFSDVPVILYTTTAAVASTTRAELEAMLAGASEFLRGAVALETLPEAVLRRVETMISLRKLSNARASLEGAEGQNGNGA